MLLDCRFVKSGTEAAEVLAAQEAAEEAERAIKMAKLKTRLLKEVNHCNFDLSCRMQKLLAIYLKG